MKAEDVRINAAVSAVLRDRNEFRQTEGMQVSVLDAAFQCLHY